MGQDGFNLDAGTAGSCTAMLVNRRLMEVQVAVRFFFRVFKSFGGTIVG